MADEEVKDEAVEQEPIVSESRNKGKKVSRMKLHEVEAALKKVEESMGGFNSGYARQLLAKKEQLSNTTKSSSRQKKAA